MLFAKDFDIIPGSERPEYQALFSNLRSNDFPEKTPNQEPKPKDEACIKKGTNNDESKKKLLRALKRPRKKTLVRLRTVPLILIRLFRTE